MGWSRLKQELAIVAYKVPTERVQARIKTALSIVEAPSSHVPVEESCQDHDGYRTFFGSCRAHLFIDYSRR